MLIGLLQAMMKEQYKKVKIIYCFSPRGTQCPFEMQYTISIYLCNNISKTWTTCILGCNYDWVDFLKRKIEI